MIGTDRFARIRPALPAALGLAVVAVLYGANLGGYPDFGNDDEGTYYAQAWAVATEGRLAHYTYWYDHPPLGWIQLAAVLRPARWLAGDQPALVGGRAVLALVMVACAALLYRVARNAGLPRTASLAVLGIWCLSPLTVFYGRQVLLDTIALAWLLAALALATGSRRWRRPALSGVCFGIAVLSKETAALAALGVLVALYTSAGGGGLRSSGVVRWLAAAGLATGGWVAYAALSGDVLPLLGAIEWQLHGRGGSGSVLDPGSTAYRIVASWFSHDPYLLCIGLAAVPLGLARRATRGIALIPVVLILTGLRPGGYLPAMHVITVLPFLALLTGYAGWQTWRAATGLPGRSSAVARGTVAVLAAVSVLAAAVPWASGARTALTADDNAGYRQALSFATSLPRDTVVLTDDVTWNDLVRLGWSGNGWDGALWHYKLDRDPAAVTELPGGWRDVDYLLAGRAMESLLGTPAISWQQSPEVLSAWRNSTVVGSWGPPDAPVVLRRIDPAGALGCRQRTCPAQEPAWTTADTGRR